MNGNGEALRQMHERVLEHNNKLKEMEVIRQAGEDYDFVHMGLAMGGMPGPQDRTNIWDLIVSAATEQRDYDTHSILVHFKDEGRLPNMEVIEKVAELVADNVAQDKKVLVHCDFGLNRSGLIAALALIRLGLSPQQAIERLRDQRNILVLTNRAFERYVLAKGQ